MDQKPDFEKDLASIRNLMERSVKFLSLSGLAGVISGVYALSAAVYVYITFYKNQILSPTEFLDVRPDQVFHLMVVGIITLVASLTTGWYFSYRKASKVGDSMWNAVSRKLFFNLSIPLISGGIFVLIMIQHEYYGLVAPACLLFYGLALVNASQNLVDELKYLGYSEIILGLLAAVYMGFSLVFWSIGFGVLHIVYGLLMYRKYDA